MESRFSVDTTIDADIQYEASKSLMPRYVQLLTWVCFGLSVVLQLLVIYVPFLNGPFGTTPLSPLAWVECICLAAFVLIASEIYKAIMRAIDKARGKELSH